MYANAVCLTCGTNQQNAKTGFCINDHDDWVEESDSVLILNFSKKFNKSISEVLGLIKHDTGDPR
jgi:hypothetical protein